MWIETNKRKGPSDRELQTAAFIHSQQPVKQRLRAPSTAEFPSFYFQIYRDGDTFTVRSHVDAQNSFGAKLRKQYICTLKYKGGDIASPQNWVVASVDIE